MSASEIAVITNQSGAADWFEIADASHDVVQFCNNFSSSTVATHISLGDTAPSDGIELAGIGPLVRLEHANAKVWARIKAGHSLIVMRGDAVLIA